MSEEQFHDDKIDELLDLTRENNKILRSMHRRMLWSQLFTFIYWLIILGVVGSAYYFAQPYFQEYVHSYQVMLNMFGSMDPALMQGILDKVR